MSDKLRKFIAKELKKQEEYSDLKKDASLLEGFNPSETAGLLNRSRQMANKFAEAKKQARARQQQNALDGVYRDARTGQVRAKTKGGSTPAINPELKQRFLEREKGQKQQQEFNKPAMEAGKQQNFTPAAAEAKKPAATEAKANSLASKEKDLRAEFDKYDAEMNPGSKKTTNIKRDPFSKPEASKQNFSFGKETKFGDAFKQARAGGAQEFEWGGKKFHTHTKGDFARMNKEGVKDNKYLNAYNKRMNAQKPGGLDNTVKAGLNNATKPSGLGDTVKNTFDQQRKKFETGGEFAMGSSTKDKAPTQKIGNISNKLDAQSNKMFGKDKSNITNTVPNMFNKVQGDFNKLANDAGMGSTNSKTSPSTGAPAPGNDKSWTDGAFNRENKTRPPGGVIPDSPKPPAPMKRMAASEKETSIEKLAKFVEKQSNLKK
jgi:hypothetical protein